MKLRDFVAEARLEQLRQGPDDADAANFRNADGSLNMEAISRYANHLRVIGGENGAGILVVRRGYLNLPGLTARECEDAWEAYHGSEEFLAECKAWCAQSEHLFRDIPRAPPPVEPEPAAPPNPLGLEPVPPQNTRRTLRR